MALYLKYRPKSFAEVVGQDHIVTLLENAVERDGLVHSYLFYGPRGTGKTSVARILAKILLICRMTDENMQKHILKAVDDDNLVDLMEIDAASHTQVDHIRELIEKIQYPPTVACAKVYIIDEVHMLSKSAFNALLKTLEEPPEYAYFILATTEPHKVPETIHSRCQRFAFLRLKEADIIQQLQNVADLERITVDREALRAIAHHVSGSLRDGLSILEQLSSLPKITKEDVRDRLGESGEEYVEQAFESAFKCDRKALLDLSAALEKHGIAAETFLRQVLEAVRGRLHQAVEDGRDTTLWTKGIDLLIAALENVRISPVSSVVLEGALLELCVLLSGEWANGKEERAKAPTFAKPGMGEEKDAKGSKEAKASGAKEQPPARKDAAEYTVRELTVEVVREMWEELLKQLDAPPSLLMSLKTASVRSVRRNVVELTFSSEFHKTRVEKAAASAIVEQCLGKTFGSGVRIACALEGEAPAAEDDGAVNLVEAAREVFGGK
jgi:DNA polymerase-3 subunit gamma/tau